VGLWKRASLSIGAPLLRSMEGQSFPRPLKRRKNYSLFREKFHEEFEKYVKKAPVNGQLRKRGHWKNQDVDGRIILR
jgi:hypothetical protein